MQFHWEKSLSLLTSQAWFSTKRSHSWIVNTDASIYEQNFNALAGHIKASFNYFICRYGDHFSTWGPDTNKSVTDSNNHKYKTINLRLIFLNWTSTETASIKTAASDAMVSLWLHITSLWQNGCVALWWLSDISAETFLRLLPTMNKLYCREETWKYSR